MTLNTDERDVYEVKCNADGCESVVKFARDFISANPTWETMLVRPVSGQATKEFHFCPTHVGTHHSAFGITNPSPIIQEERA